MSQSAVTVLTPPAVEPVSIAEAKAHVKQDQPHEDVAIAALITAARETVEAFTRRALISQGLRLTLDWFPSFGPEIRLPRPPLIEVTAVAYTDEAGGAGTVTDFQSDATTTPGRLAPAIDAVWPATQSGKLAAVQIDYTAGYGENAPAVPKVLVQAVLLLFAHWYANREAVSVVSLQEIPFGVKALLWPFVVTGA